MSSTRETQLARLATILATASVKTVVVTNTKISGSSYTAAEFPLVEVVPGMEAPAPYLTSRMAMWKYSVSLTCYFLDDINSDIGDQEPLLKEMKDAVGGDPTLNGTCVAVEVRGTRNGGDFPMWTIGLELSISYEKKISEA